MERGNLEGSLKEALVELKHYVDLQVRYQKLLLAKRLSELSSLFVLFMLMFGVCAFMLLFLSFTFIEWYASFGERLHGRMIVTGFYFVTGFIIFILREQLVFSPMRKMFGNVLMGDDKDPKMADSFKSKERLNLQIDNYKEILATEEDDLKIKFQKAGETFTVGNIFQGIAKSVYKTIVTTSNIARMAYSLVSKFKGSSKKKRRKKSGKNPEELEEINE